MESSDRPLPSTPRVLLALLVLAWVCVDLALGRHDVTGPSWHRDAVSWLMVAIAAQLPLVVAWLVWGREWFAVRLILVAALVLAPGTALHWEPIVNLALCGFAMMLWAMLAGYRWLGLRVETSDEEPTQTRAPAAWQFAVGDLLAIMTVLAVALTGILPWLRAIEVTPGMLAICAVGYAAPTGCLVVFLFTIAGDVLPAAFRLALLGMLGALAAAALGVGAEGLAKVLAVPLLSGLSAMVLHVAGMRWRMGAPAASATAALQSV